MSNNSHHKKTQTPLTAPRGVGNMTTGPIERVPVKSMGRHQSRVYCPVCGAKRNKDGDCPRGHPA